MYFRRSLNKIVKVRPLVSSVRFCRHSHTSYARQYMLSTYENSRNAEGPLLLSTFSRSFSVANSKKSSRESEKPVPKSRSVGIDLMAPNFRNYYSLLKSTTKNRREIGNKFHTMPQKSLTLKMCRQPSKSLSTSHTNVGQSQSESKTEKGGMNTVVEKIEKKEEVDTVVTKSKSDICRAICGPNSSKITPDSAALTPSSDLKVSKRAIDQLTNAEVEEVCRTRCPCRESHNAVHTNQTAEKIISAAPAIQSRKCSKKLEGSTTTNQSSGKSESLAKILPFTTVDSRNTRRKRKAEQKFDMTSSNVHCHHRHTFLSQYGNILRHIKHELSTVNDYRQTSSNYPFIAPQKLSRPEDSFRLRPSVGGAYPTQSLPIGTSNQQLKSKYMRMIRSKQSSSVPLGYRPTPEREMQPNSSQVFPTQIEKNANPCAGSTKNGCHFEQLKPVPFRFRPIYPKSYHSDPVVKYRNSSRFGAMYVGVGVGVPYKSSQWHKRQKLQKKSPVFGSQISKNRKTLDIQPNMPKWTPSPIQFTNNKTVNTDNVTVDNSKGITLPVTEDVLDKNVNVEKGQIVNEPIVGIDTAQQSRKIMSKLVENLSVVIEGPAKLKLVTSSYPRLRNEKDVIIQMEYVNLTGADTRHYLTGKYSSYSYATTTVGRTGSGIIIETGQNVRSVKPGDKVYVKPISCGKCSLCLSDCRNLCENVTVSELSPIQGILSRLHVHSSEFVTKIPDNVSVFNGAMTWTLSTAIRECQKAAISAGDVVMVIGGGALGTATSLAAQMMGATTVCLADIRKPVLDAAQNLGIGEVFLIDPKSPSKNTAIKVWEHIGVYPRVTFDCRGSQLTNEIAINATQTGGKVVVMTNSEIGISLPISHLVTRDIDIIIATCGNDESDTAALRFLSAKNIFFDSLMDKHYDWSNIKEAFEHLHGPNRVDSQIIVKCG